MCIHTTAMEIPKTHLLVIPGQNGLGGGNVETYLPYFAKHTNLIHEVATPFNIPDFGQSRCQKYLQETIDILNPNDRIIIHASSQGTATALNYASKHPEKIDALILEAVMLTGNSAISHTVENLMMPGATSLPGSYHLMPYLAKCQYPYYCPAGEQPICNVDKLPKNLPIIIIHHEKDLQLSHADAQALYAYLKLNNHNVYFISMTSEWQEHVNLLLPKHMKQIANINNILKKNNLLPYHPMEILSINSDYQPEPKQAWLDHFNNLLHKEHTIQVIDPCIKGMLLIFLLYKFSIIHTVLNAVSLG